MAIVSAGASSSATASSSGTSVRHVGRFRRGDTLEFSFVPSGPLDGVPYAYIVNANGTPGFVSERILVPSLDASRLSFGASVLIDGEYQPGTYVVEFYTQVDGQPATADCEFDVIGGGDAGGAVLSMFAVDRPEARCLVAQVEGGQLVFGKSAEIAS